MSSPRAGIDDPIARRALRARRLRWDVFGWLLLREALCHLVAPAPQCHGCGAPVADCERALGHPDARPCCPACNHDNCGATATLRAWLVKVDDDVVLDRLERIQASIARGEVR